MRWIPLVLTFLFSWVPFHHPVVTRSAPLIKNVLTTKKVVALTFDDGPTAKWTPQILATLKENHAHATFFVIGSHAIRRPEILRQEVDAHMEIGSHGYDHKTLRGQSAETVRAEVQRNEELLTSLGIPKPALYRMPGGASDTTALEVLGQMGYKVIGWSIDTRDWRHRYSAEQLASLVEKKVQPGAIVIFHDGPNSSSATVNAVKEIVPTLTKEGWTFDTVSQMLKLEKR